MQAAQKISIDTALVYAVERLEGARIATRECCNQSGIGVNLRRWCDHRHVDRHARSSRRKKACRQSETGKCGSVHPRSNERGSHMGSGGLDRCRRTVWRCGLRHVIGHMIGCGVYLVSARRIGVDGCVTTTFDELHRAPPP